MRDNTQNGSSSRILSYLPPQTPENRQLSHDLPCTTSSRVGEIECEKRKFIPKSTQSQSGLDSTSSAKTKIFQKESRSKVPKKEKIKAKGHPSAHAKNKEFYPQEGISQAKKKEFYPHEGIPYLQIQSVPLTERVDPTRHSYVLVVQPVGVRACGGQYSASEAHEIAKLTKGWDWTLDPDDKPRCLPRLEALLDRICKRSSLGNEASEAGQLGLFLTKSLPANQDSLVKKLQNEGGEV